MLMLATPPLQTMKLTSLRNIFVSALLLCTAIALGQSAPAGGPSAQSGEPVSYASVTQLNGVLAQLEAASKSTQADLVKLRIEHWKTSAASKKDALAAVDSVQRNLQNSLPDVISQLRAAPEDLSATFKLYRNLDALCDVFGSVAEGAAQLGTKDEQQALANDLEGFANARKQIAQRMESLSSTKEAELVRLRAALKTAQAAIPAAPPKITVVDDNQPAKKPAVKKKPVAKPTTTPPGAAKPPAGQTTPATTPPATQPPPAPKPQ